jgi:single-strand DNA-binding protein
MNSIQLIGRLTRDPELRQTATGKSVGNLRLAVDRRDREAAPVYVDVTVWNAQAETCAQHLAKGRQVGVTGRLDYQEWKAEDGSTRSRHEVIASDVEFLARPKGNDGS